jgi:hypothetical protein
VVRTVLTCVLLLVGAGSAAAQEGVRSGLWLEAAIGTATVRNSCGRCDAVTAAYGGTDYLRLGHSISPRVLLGIEVFSLGASDLVLGPGAMPVEGVNRSIAPVVIWYVGESGFFLKGGAGIARGTFTVPTATPTAPIRRTGSALTFGVGFDIPIARWLALTANLGTNVMSVGDVDVNGTVVDDIIATIYEVGVGVTLR